MIRMDDLVGCNDFNSLPVTHQLNLKILLERVNSVQRLFKEELIVTSGYRTMEDHLRIYREKGITDESKIPMKSNHLFGKAVDISDPGGILKAFCKANHDKVLIDAELWCEASDATPGWCHFQTVPPKSGNRWFEP